MHIDVGIESTACAYCTDTIRHDTSNQPAAEQLP